MNTNLKARIARRLKARRESLKLSQDEMARQMGFNSRQTLTSLETGDRNIKPEELVAAARILGVGLDFFTDPYSAAGEASFSFRAETDDSVLVDFEARAGGWIATYQALGAEEGQPASYLVPALALSRTSSYEDAQAAAEQVREKLGLGRIPARELEVALEREWGILVLYVDAPSGISGAASRLDRAHAILINRNEPVGRRNYNLAHELFHLLTWDAMPPRRIDSETPSQTSRRVEELANNFAAALLMPRATVLEMWNARRESSLQAWLAITADELKVSASALKWRLVNLGCVSPPELPSDGEIYAETGERNDRATQPQLFNVSFVQRIYSAVESGSLSLRKASRLLGLDTVSFARLCQAYGRQLSYDV
jgi:Zn-dependent peptidase ImmA (M78 family)/DNA-binding XRE family transcriptional regulator